MSVVWPLNNQWSDNEDENAVLMHHRIDEPLDDLNSRINTVQSGIETVSIPNAANSATGTVTYATAYTGGVQPYPFTQVAHSAGPQTSVVITSRSSTGFTYKVFRCDGTNAGSGGTPSNFYWKTDNL